MKDEETGLWCKRKHPGDVVDFGTVIPDHAPLWMAAKDNLKEVWNGVQASETRKNSRLATHWDSGLYRDSTKEQQIEVMKEIAQAVVDRYGCIVTWAVHDATNHGDGRNAHGHIVMNDRKMTSEGFGDKLRVLNTRQTGPAEIVWFREMVADKINGQLDRTGAGERVTHLSYEARGINQIPTKHLGNEAFQAELRGGQTEQGNYNRAVTAINLETERIKRRPMDEREIVAVQQREQTTIEALKQQDAHIQAFKEKTLREAEDAPKKPKQGNAAADRYTMALGESVCGDPYLTLAKAAALEGATFKRDQQELAKQIATEKDPYQKRQLEFVKEIQAYDYMALTSKRIAGIGEVLAGRKDHPDVMRDRANGKAYTDNGKELRLQQEAHQEAHKKEQSKEVGGELGKLAQRVARGELSQKTADRMAQSQSAAPSQGRAASRGR